jgi:hypothetical protein
MFPPVKVYDRNCNQEFIAPESLMVILDKHLDVAVHSRAID